MILVLNILANILLVFGQYPGEEQFTITEAPDPNPSFVTLLSSHSYPCASSEVEKKCERNLIYEKDSESIYQMISDGRDLQSGDMDINEILRDPAGYGGSISTITLSDLFDGQSKFDSVIARYTKDKKIYIEVMFNNKKVSKEIAIPEN